MLNLHLKTSRINLVRSLMVCCFLFLAFNTIPIHAQAPNFKWAQSITSSGSVRQKAIAVEKNGNTHVIGNYYNDLSFGGLVLTNNGSSRGFVGKCDAAGKVSWLRLVGSGPGDSTTLSNLVVDASGNTLVAGFFNNTCTLGAFTLINPNPAALKLTPFVAKYDSAGNVLRAQMLSTNSVYLAAMALDSFNNLYLTGRFYATANFSGISLVSTNSSNGTSFLAKYDPNGNIQWIQLVSGTTHAIAVDEAGNGFLTGGFSGRVATFGSLSVTNSSLLGTYVNMFVAKFDNAGNWLWASQGGGSGSLADCYGTSLAVDTDGNCYVCGDYNHSFATFGSVTLPALSVFSNGFLAKYNSAGAALWAIRLGGSGPDGLASANEFNSLALDCVGNVFISGQSSSTNVSLGSITLTNTNAYNLQTNAHNLSIFAAKFDSSGNALWAKQALGAYTGEFSGISVDAYDNVYLLGSFDGQGIFDALTLNSPNKPWFFISRINGPELSLCSANSQMLVAWPTNAVGLHLESTGDLNANAWSAMPNEPTVIGTQNTVTVSASGSSQFFRLSGP